MKRTGTRSAFNDACRLLRYRGRSELELVKRLRLKGHDSGSVENAISRLRACGFLDDRKLASSLRRLAEESKYLSIPGTRRFLRERGIPSDMAEEAVHGLNEEETARRFVEKKMLSWQKDPSFLNRATHDIIRKKLCGMLSRKGYAPELINRLLRNLQKNEEEA